MYMDKQDLALNNLQGLICHKIQPHQIKPNYDIILASHTFYLEAYLFRGNTVCSSLVILSRYKVKRISFITATQCIQIIS